MPHRRILSSLNEPVFELDGDGSVVYATPAIAEWTGIEFSPAAPYRFADTLVAKDRTRFNQAFKRIVEGRTLKTSITLRLNAKGAGKHGAVELTLAALLGASTDESTGKPTGGKLVGIAASLRDSRAEKSAEATANLQSAHLLDLVENITNACVVESADGSVEMVNAAFCELFEIDVAPQSWVATSCASLFELASMVVDANAGPVYPTHVTHEPSVATLSMGKKQVSHTTLTVMNDDDAAAFAGRLHLFKLLGNEDKVAKQADGKHVANHIAPGANHRVQLQFIERIRADLAATTRAAFTAIQHAEQVELSSRALEQFRRVEASAQAAVDAMAGLVDLGDIDSHTIGLNTAPFLLRDSIAGVLDILLPRAEEHGVDVSLRIEQDVPDTLTGDGARLVMALRHLIEIGFGDDRLSIAHDSNNAAKIALTVQPEYADNDVIHLSFTVEHTAPKSSADAGVLTATNNMQLALARQIARALANPASPNGHESDLGKTRIALNKQDIEVHQKLAQRGEKMAHITTYKFTAAFSFTHEKVAPPRDAFVTLTGMQVLLVSADKHERERLAELTRNWRMLPREADDAAMALQLLNRMAGERTAIPLVITSNRLPLQDGFLLAFRIKHHPKLNAARVVMLAKNGKPGDAIQCRENGISAYLRDPISPDQLVDAIGAVMGTKDDAEATQTLITRHSLREAKTGTVLLIDAHHDQATMAATLLKRRDFRVVVVDTAEAAATSLAHDIFDVIIVDASVAGFESSLSIAAQLRLHFPAGADMPILLALSDYAKVDAVEYQGVITKPYEKDALLEKVASAIAENSAPTKDATTKYRRSSDLSK